MSGTERTNPIKYVTHKGQEIMLFDLTGVTDTPDPETSAAFYERARQEFASKPPGSVRMLVALSPNIRFNKEMVAAEREVAQKATPYLKKSAVVGSSQLGMAIIATLRFFTGRDIRTFDTMEEALDWLAE